MPPPAVALVLRDIFEQISRFLLRLLLLLFCFFGQTQELHSFLFRLVAILGWFLWLFSQFLIGSKPQDIYCIIA